MIIEHKKKYTLLTFNDHLFSDSLKEFEKAYELLIEKHLIIKFSEDFSITEKDILLLLEHAEKHQQNGTSFAVVKKDVNIDEFPEWFNIVPTLVEAEDVLEMEEMQRDLGF